MGNKLAMFALVVTIVVLLVTFCVPQEFSGDSSDNPQTILDRNDIEMLDAASDERSSDDHSDAASDTNTEEVIALVTPPQDIVESPSLYFITEKDYVRVATFWTELSQRNRSTWIGRLESELGKEDDAENSRDLEQLAASAVILDPRYSYDPRLSTIDIQPSCRNYVCKVEIPASFGVSSDYSAPRMVPGSILNTYDSVLFNHGFGYHLVQRQISTNTTTHYFLGNGFELDD